MRLADVDNAIEDALDRVAFCFQHIQKAYYVDHEGHRFDHLMTDQYATFLYFLSNTLGVNYQAREYAKKVYALNKSLHGIDLYFEVEMPKVFRLRHCIGTILGRAKYGEFLSVGPNCTVGNDNNVYPVIGDYVGMYNGSSIVGGSTIGNNVHVSAQTFIRNERVPDNTVVVGRSPNLEFHRANRTVAEEFFDQPEV